MIPKTMNPAIDIPLIATTVVIMLMGKILDAVFDNQKRPLQQRR